MNTSIPNLGLNTKEINVATLEMVLDFIKNYGKDMGEFELLFYRNVATLLHNKLAKPDYESCQAIKSMGDLLRKASEAEHKLFRIPASGYISFGSANAPDAFTPICWPLYVP